MNKRKRTLLPQNGKITTEWRKKGEIRNHQSAAKTGITWVRMPSILTGHMKSGKVQDHLTIFKSLTLTPQDIY